MSRLLNKFLNPNSVDGSKIRLSNEEALRALKADGSGTVSFLKVNANDKPEFMVLPVLATDPTDADQVSRKGYVDTKAAAEAQGALDEAKAYVDGAVTTLVNGAPELLNTLQELAQALGSDENFATTIANQITDLDGRLDVVEGSDVTTGSVLWAKKSAIDHADQLVAQEVIDRNSAIGTLELDLEGQISAEATLRQSGDAEALQDAKDYADALVAAQDDVSFHADQASFPATGADGIIYVDKGANKIFRYESITVPGTFDHIVGPGQTFTTLQAALADASVQDGHTIQILAGTYSVASAISITKKVRIFGVDKPTVIFETAGTSSDPVNMFVVSVDDVVISNLTIKHKKTSNTSVEAAIVASGPGFPQTRIANFILDNVAIEHVEFAVTVRGSNWKIAYCQFKYMGPSNSTRRHVGIYGVSGTCIADSNESFDNGATGNTRFYAITSTTGTNPNETLEGTLAVVGCAQSSGALQQFISQDAWQGTPGSYSLIVHNNTTSETSAFISFFGTAANFGDILSQVTVSNNSLSNLHGGTPAGGKGLIGIDGSGAVAFRSSPLPVHSSLNSLGNLVFRSDYQEATGSSGAIVGKSIANIGAASVTLDAEILPVPSIPSTPGVVDVTTASYVEISEQPDLTPYALSSSLDAEITERQNADIALDGRLDTLESQVSSLESVAFHKQKKSLSATDITNQYIDLAYSAKPYSTMVFVQGAAGGYMHEGDDYTVSTVGGVTRITFAGDFATGGATALDDSDVLYVQFQYVP